SLFATTFTGSGGRFPEDRTYVHPLFKTQKECDEAKKKLPFFNCQQWVRFRTDGSVTLIVTDIVNAGTYEIRDNQVLPTMRSVAYVPRELTFTSSPDDQRLRLEPSGTVWVREKTRTPDPSDTDTLICDDKLKKLHVRVTPFKDQGTKCGDKLEFYLNEQKL